MRIQSHFVKVLIISVFILFSVIILGSIRNRQTLSKTVQIAATTTATTIPPPTTTQFSNWQWPTGIFTLPLSTTAFLNFTVLYQPRTCTSNVTILVFSTVTRVDQRNAVRNTWGKGHSVVFVINGIRANGQGVEVLHKEASKHGDLLVISLEETYRGLVFKSLASFLWASTYCTSTWIAKTDHDVLVNVERLTEKAKLFPEAITGYCWGEKTVRPIRKQDSKWYVDKSEYNGEFFPSYCTGAYYVIPRTSIVKILSQAIHAPIVYIEDVYVAGILAEHAGVPRRTVDPMSDCVSPTPCNVLHKVVYHRPNSNAEKFIKDWQNYNEMKKKTCPEPLCASQPHKCPPEKCSN